MKRLIKNIAMLFTFLFVLFSNQKVLAQDFKSKEALKIFARIEEGINTGSIDKFSNYFANRNYLSLTNGVAGYYSANQSYYVIKDFLSVTQPLNFKLTNIVTETSAPFAAGSLRYISNGIRGTATVFISLQFIENQWRISQITVN